MTSRLGGRRLVSTPSKSPVSSGDKPDSMTGESVTRRVSRGARRLHQLLRPLTVVGGGRGPIRCANRSGWPKNPRALAGRLRRAQSFLRTLGTEIVFGPRQRQWRWRGSKRSSSRTMIQHGCSMASDKQIACKSPQCDTKYRSAHEVGKSALPREFSASRPFVQSARRPSACQRNRPTC